jgi:lipopolysaccharide transport system ATP-binding protein
MRKREIDRKLDEIIDFSGVERYIDTPVKRYSSGMYVRLAFAVAAYLESEILIVDEVLAVGDAEFQKKCLGKMSEVSKGEGRTVLFVSHNITSISKLCNTSLLMEKGELFFLGPTDGVINTYQGLRKERYSGISENSYISDINIENNRKGLVLTIQFKSDFPKKHNCIGIHFVDKNGNLIFGFNSKSHVNICMSNLAGEQICILISSPKLTVGSYSISFWIGDGVQDYFISESHFQFEISVSEVTNELDYIFYPYNGNIIPQITVL